MMVIRSRMERGCSLYAATQLACGGCIQRQTPMSLLLWVVEVDISGAKSVVVLLEIKVKTTFQRLL
jgi:hypothetical protein